ncbi:MAG: hypothetical protein R3Y43_03655 [Alphaproteobacteria bacterium]
MNKRIITGGTIGLTLLLNVNISFAAESCAVATSCDELGYTMNVDDCVKGEPYLVCPFDVNKANCRHKYCYGVYSWEVNDTSKEITGVRIPNVNLCLSLIEGSSENPVVEWKDGEVRGSSGDNYYSWGYIMGFEKTCSGELCGSVDSPLGYCKTVFGGHGWRMPTRSELSQVAANYVTLNSALDNDKITRKDELEIWLWASDEYETIRAYAVSIKDGFFNYNHYKDGSNTDDLGNPTATRCVRSY